MIGADKTLKEARLSAKVVAHRLAPNADNWLLWLLVPLGILLWLLHPQSFPALLQLVDGPTLSALAGMLAVTKGIELSGVLQSLSRRLLTRVHSERRLALVLVSLSAVLAALLTNDVSLFLIVPLTCSLAAAVRLPLARLVVFEALAVNAGSALTPIGNPQNLFLWQSSGIGFAAFVRMMAPAVAVMFLLLLAATLLAFKDAPMELQDQSAAQTANSWLLGSSVLLLLILVILLNLHLTLPALVLVFAAYALIHRRVLRELDWTLLLIIALMFVDLGQLAVLPDVSGWLYQLPIGSGGNAFVAGVVVSQLISNVPATILLHSYVHDLTALAYGVNVGGFGLLIGSLANLIALRIARQPGSLRLFHLISLPFLLLTAITLWVLYF